MPYKMRSFHETTKIRNSLLIIVRWCPCKKIRSKFPRAMQVGLEAGSDKAGVQDPKSRKDAMAGATAHRLNQNAIAVALVEHEDTVVSGAGSDNKFAGLVGVNLAGGWRDHGSKTMMSKVIVGVARVISASSGGLVAGVEGGIPKGALGARLVGRRFLRAWSRWPMTIATDCGGCWRSVFVVSPRKGGGGSPVRGRRVVWTRPVRTTLRGQRQRARRVWPTRERPRTRTRVDAQAAGTGQ